MKRKLYLFVLVMTILLMGCNENNASWSTLTSQGEVWSGNYAIAKYNEETEELLNKTTYALQIVIYQDYADVAFCLVEDVAQNQYFLDQNPVEEMGCRFDYAMENGFMTFSNPIIQYHTGNKQLDMSQYTVLLFEPVTDEYNMSSNLSYEEHRLADFFRPTQRTTYTNETWYGGYHKGAPLEASREYGLVISKVTNSSKSNRTHPAWVSEPQDTDQFQIIAYGGDWLSGSTTDYVVCFFDAEEFIHIRPFWCGMNSLEYDTKKGELSPGRLPEEEQISEAEPPNLVYQFNQALSQFERK